MLRRGVTLIEVLLAVLILGIGVGAVARDIAVAVTQTRRAFARLDAIERAARLLEVARVAPCPITVAGAEPAVRIDTLPLDPPLPMRRRCP